MSTTLLAECQTLTSTGGKRPRKAKATEQSGVLSSHQMTALIQQGKWWPFDRVPGEILVKMNAKLMRDSKQTINQAEEALL